MDTLEFRKSFPQLERKMGPQNLIYLDSGASSLKHSAVSDRVNSFNRFEASNVHRGAHYTSREGTENYEGARQRIQKFINASSDQEIIFTRGTTEAVNLLAYSLEQTMKAGDEILITPFEHHSNIVPWQILCERTGAILKVVPFDSEKGMTLEAFQSSFSPKTRLASFIFHSNSFGHRLPVEEMVVQCKKHGVLSCVDAAQTMLSEKIDVLKLGCDFLCFSGHKMYGPYGIGVLYIKGQHLGTLPPYQTGGSMVDRVSFEKTSFAEAPQKFEAGTPNISGAIGLGAAIDVLNNIDFQSHHEHVLQMRNALLEGLSELGSVQVYNFPASDYTGILSFNVEGAHPTDVGTLLDKYGIAARAGHHCTQPLMNLMDLPGTVRVSLAPYNTMEEVAYLLRTMEKMKEFF